MPETYILNAVRALPLVLAVARPEAITKPLLIMHGAEDTSVPPRHSLDLARRSSELGRIYSLIVFAEDGHILADSQVERDAATVAWFRRYAADVEAETLDRLQAVGTEEEIHRHGHRQHPACDRVPDEAGPRSRERCPTPGRPPASGSRTIRPAPG